MLQSFNNGMMNCCHLSLSLSLSLSLDLLKILATVLESCMSW